VFTPLIGGTTQDDIKTGHVKGLQDGKSIVPQKTTIMKIATVSTLFDYIQRAMPWNAPKSLTTDQVYGVLAYLLNLAEIIPSDYVLSEKTMPEVQARMPNRNGFVIYEPMWNVKGKGDVKNVACMKNCDTEMKVHSFLPDYAKNAQGNTAEQNRIIGPVRGLNTDAPAGK
jgi:cytochrome c